MKPNQYNILKSILLFSILWIPSFGHFAQEKDSVPVAGAKEKMVCQKIELIINGQVYDDGHKCVSQDAICYLVEGLSLSCFANPYPDLFLNKPKTN